MAPTTHAALKIAIAELDERPWVAAGFDDLLNHDAFACVPRAELIRLDPAPEAIVLAVDSAPREATGAVAALHADVPGAVLVAVTPAADALAHTLLAAGADEVLSPDELSPDRLRALVAAARRRRAARINCPCPAGRLAEGLREVVGIADELMTAPDMDSLYRRAVELARERLGVERAALFMLDDGGSGVHGTFGTDLEGATTDERSYRAPSCRLSLDSRPPGGRTTRWGSFHDAYLLWSDGELKRLDRSGWQAWSLVASPQRTWGALCNDAAISGAPLDPGLQELLAIYGSMLGSVIDRRRAELSLQRWARQQEAIAELGRQALLSDDLDELMQRTCELLCETLEVRHISVLELATSGEWLFLSWGVGWPKGMVGRFRVPLDHTPPGHAVRTGQTVVVDRWDQAAEFPRHDVVVDAGVVSVVSVLIGGSERPFGVLDVHSTTPARFGPDECHFVQAVANVLATAIRRREADWELYRGEQRMRAVMNAAPIITFAIDAIGNLTLCEGNALSHLGRRPGELAGRSVYELFDDRPDVLDLVDEILHGPASHRRVAIEDRIFDGHFTPHVGPDGTPAGVFGVLVDVTDTVAAEQALRASEEHLRLLVDNIADIIVVSEGGRLSYASPSFERVLGYDIESRLGQPLMELVHPDDVPLARGVLESSDAQQPPVEVRVRHRDGSLLYVEAVARRGAPGSPLNGLIITARDVTARRAAEQQIKLQAAALEAVDHGVDIADIEGCIVWVNAAFSAMTGYSPEQAIGQTHRLLLGRPMSDEAFERHWSQVLGGPVWRAEPQHLRADGTPYLSAVSKTPVTDHRGEITHVVSIRQDITEQRRLEEQLRQAQKMEAIGRLAGGVAHDFNNILATILGYGEMLQQGLDPRERRFADLQQIIDAARRAAGLTNQLLAFSRKQMVQPKVLDLNAVVRDLYPMLRRLIGEDIDLVEALAEPLAPVYADANQLEQVLLNLAVNARDAMPGGGRLSISTDVVALSTDEVNERLDLQPGRYVALCVRDTGTGMDDETRARVFEPFFTTKEQGRGTGLGLATVYGIVKQSGGDIALESSPGRGTSFHVFLPIAPNGSAPDAVGSDLADDAPGGRETVLLVEDEGAVRVLTRRILERHGYTVLEAGLPQVALELVRCHDGPLDLLVTDMVMPHMNGRRLAEEIVELRPGLRVLFMSGYTDEDMISQGLLDPAAAFLKKPFPMDTLLRKVRLLLDG